MTKFFCALLLISLASTPLYAEQTPRGLSADGRIKMVNYDPNNVIRINAHYGYQTMIVFDNEETVQNVSIGDALAWQAVPVSNHLFIKPVAGSTTNMTVLTNLRSYNFQLESSNAKVGHTYELKFIYFGQGSQYTQSAGSSNQNPPLSQYNWKYSYTGDGSQAPTQALDNGKFTYFKFKEMRATSLPAIFSVDSDRTETLLNYHLEGEYLVVNCVANQFTLRNGDHVTSVYNDAALGDWQTIS